MKPIFADSYTITYINGMNILKIHTDYPKISTNRKKEAHLVNRTVNIKPEVLYFSET